MDETIKDTKRKEIGCWKMKEVEISELCYVDNMIIIAKDENSLNGN